MGKRERAINGQEREDKFDQNSQKISHPHTPSDTGVGKNIFLICLNFLFDLIIKS